VLFAEEVHLKDGKIIPGTIVSSDTDSVNLKTEYGEIRIERKDINKVEYAKPIERKKLRKFAVGFEMNPYSYYTSAIPLWAFGISYLPSPKVAIQAMGSYFSLWGRSVSSIYFFYGYPIKVAENPEISLFINAGCAYQHAHYEATYYSSSYDYDAWSALVGLTLESHPLSYLPNFGYSVRGGISYSWFPNLTSYSYAGNAMWYYLSAGLFYYLF